MHFSEITKKERKRERPAIRTVLCFSFLVFSLLFSCNNKSEEKPITVQWENNKATAIFIPSSFFKEIPADSLIVSIADTRVKEPILGEYRHTDSGVVFRPLIPFTRGMRYAVTARASMLGLVQIPPPENNPPQLVSIYPTQDTLPENQLKLYLLFSKPMQEGTAMKNLVLIRGDKDTVTSAFLDLQQELWDHDRKMLTLWFDPGRIKRDLQPNKTMGAPLKKGERYRLLISEDWEDTEAIRLGQSYKKMFVTTSRDDKLPDPNKWDIQTPVSGTKDALIIEFKESLDYALIKSSITITDKAGNNIDGTIETGKKETSMRFIPADAWKAETYVLVIESRIEDLAGNNMIRLFDNDLTKPQNDKVKGEFRITFIIK